MSPKVAPKTSENNAEAQEAIRLMLEAIQLKLGSLERIEDQRRLIGDVIKQHDLPLKDIDKQRARLFNMVKRQRLNKKITGLEIFSKPATSVVAEYYLNMINFQGDAEAAASSPLSASDGDLNVQEASRPKVAMRSDRTQEAQGVTEPVKSTAPSTEVVPDSVSGTTDDRSSSITTPAKRGIKRTQAAPNYRELSSSPDPDVRSDEAAKQTMQSARSRSDAKDCPAFGSPASSGTPENTQDLTSSSLPEGLRTHALSKKQKQADSWQEKKDESTPSRATGKEPATTAAMFHIPEDGSGQDGISGNFPVLTTSAPIRKLQTPPVEPENSDNRPQPGSTSQVTSLLVKEAAAPKHGFPQHRAPPQTAGSHSLGPGQKRGFESPEQSLQPEAKRLKSPTALLQIASRQKIASDMKSLLQKTNLLAANYCTERGVNLAGIAEFIAHPSPDLESLYAQIFQSGTNRNWKQTHLALDQSLALPNLIAADIFQSVFSGKAMWDERGAVGDTFASLAKYLELDAVDILVREAAFRRMNDKEFQNGEVAACAEQLALTLNITLAPHLDRMAPGKPRMQSAKWINDLAEIYCGALIIRGTIGTYHDGTFESFWPDIGSRMDPITTDPSNGYNKHLPQEVRAVRWPGLKIVGDGSDTILSRAQVLTMLIDEV